jgi:Flp pilus assembly protein TadG
MIRKLKTFTGETRGVAAVEFALIAPFLVVVYLGLFDLVQLIMTNRKVTYSAAVVADLVTQSQTNILKPQIDDFYNAAAMVMNPVVTSDFRVEVYGYTVTTPGPPPGLSAAPDWKTSSGTGTSCGATPAGGTFSNLATAGNDIIVARVCTTFTPWLATFLGQYILGAPNFTVTQQVAQRPRTVGPAKLTCWASTIGGAKCV